MAKARLFPVAAGFATIRTTTPPGKLWSEMDLWVKNSLEDGETIEEVATFLCRSGSVDDVKKKADELGLTYRSKNDDPPPEPKMVSRVVHSKSGPRRVKYFPKVRGTLKRGSSNHWVPRGPPEPYSYIEA